MAQTVVYRGYTIQAFSTHDPTEDHWKPSGWVDTGRGGDLHRWDVEGNDVPSFITGAAAEEYMIETAKQWIDENLP